MKKLIILIAFAFILLVGQSANQPVQAKPSAADGDYFTYLPMAYRALDPVWLGPDGGKIVSIAIDPINPNTLYAGTWGAGIFKTTDGGSNWYPVNTGLGYPYIWSLAVDPSQSNIVYAGTDRNKLYKSVNGGASWFLSSNGIQDGAIVYDILIDPTNPARVYISTRGISNNGNPPWNGVIYRSFDSGSSWRAIVSNYPSSYQQDWAYGLAINPSSPKNIYAAMHQSGIYHSDDYGISWYKANDGLPVEAGGILNTRDILIDVSHSPLYAYTGLWHAGVYKSTNNLSTWLPANSGLLEAKIFRATLDPNQPNIIYLSDQNSLGVFKSINGGSSWYSSGLSGMMIWDVLVNPQNSQTLYAATNSDGIFKSTNAGSSWFHAQNGLTNLSTTGTATRLGYPQILYVSTIDKGVYQTTDYGATWNEYNQNLSDLSIHALVQHPTNPNLVYALSDAGGLFSTDISLGNGWTSLNSGLPVTSSTILAYDKSHPLAEAPLPDADLIDEVSKPEGMTAPSAQNPLLSMAFAPSNPSIVYLGTSGDGVYKSVNGAVTWAPAGLSGQSVWSLAVDPTNPDKVYAAMNAAGGVKASQNGGLSWQDLSVGTLNVYSLAFSSSTLASLFAGTNNGLYQWVNGSGWVFRGYAGVSVTALAARSTTSDYLYVGTTLGSYTYVVSSQAWVNGPPVLANQTVQAINFDLNEPLKGYFSTSALGVLLAQIPH